MAVTNQPTTYPLTDFQTGLCDCFEDPKTCCYGFFCFPCLACSIAADMDECFCCGFFPDLRSVYRTKYNIEGKLILDCCLYAYGCGWCAVCQLKRDIEFRKEQGIF